jgi:glucose/arabinose dehydrogenase
MRRLVSLPRIVGVIAIAAVSLSVDFVNVAAQTTPTPSVVDPNLVVRPVVTGLLQPTSMAFLGPDDFFVLEKASGRVWRVTDGQATVVLDLAVNSNSERGLLGIALHPNFPGNPGVYLFWTESSTGSDTTVVSNVALLGNRVDRFEWNGTSLTQGINIIMLRAFQADQNQQPRGNHNGGVLRFGPDGKLYIVIGDEGRRGWLQNLQCGPTPSCPGTIVTDDQFGGPQPDAAHLTGVILRLNDDGTTPADNPLIAGANQFTGETRAAIQKIFAYGLRNTFGMAFDPQSGALWLEQNGDDTFTELGRVLPGMNGGWVQIMGPVSRLAEYKAIETSPQFNGLQQVRWPPSLIADTPEEALSRLVMFEGAHYADPDFSWKFEVAPAGLGFMSGRGLGPQYEGDLFLGAARETLLGGNIFRFDLTGNRRKIGVDDPRLEDRVADNLAKFDLTESESLLFGTNFGIGTDIHTGPDGNLYVVSNTHGRVYAISRRVK